MKLKMKNVVCTHWFFLSVQYSRMYCTYDFLRYCTYDYIALTRRTVISYRIKMKRELINLSLLVQMAHSCATIVFTRARNILILDANFVAPYTPCEHTIFTSSVYDVAGRPLLYRPAI